jgi:hypothetical protein
MRLVSVDSIVVQEKRQRKKFAGLKELASSIEEQTPHLPETQGLIHPIVLRGGNILVVGERRLKAVKSLGRKLIAVNDFENLSEKDARVIELEENFKRLDITWQEETLAIEEIHELYRAADPENWTQDATGKRLGLSAQAISTRLKVASAMRANPDIEKAGSLSTAIGICMRSEERDLDDMVTDITHAIVFGANKPTGQVAPKLMGALAAAGALPLQNNLHNLVTPVLGVPPQSGPAADLLAGLDDILGKPSVVTAFQVEPESPLKPARESLFNADFKEFVKTYQGAPFNFIHCDFPYGAGAGKADSQINVGGDHGRYEDSVDIFWDLCRTLLDGMSNVVAESAHIMLWYQSARYKEVVLFFEEYADIFQLTVFPIPLIWYKSDGSGVVSDPARRPRHVYETALVISRGDRKVVKTIGDVYAAPISRHIHPAEKPQPMLQYFFQMFVGAGTRMLDPTAGSATSLRAAESCGASEVHGLEIDERFFNEAILELDSFRRKFYLDQQLQALVGTQAQAQVNTQEKVQ